VKSSLYLEAAKTRARAYPPPRKTALGLVARAVRVVAEGDSWFSYFPAYDVLATLRGEKWAGGRSYVIKGAPRAGSYLNDMVYHPRQLADTFQHVVEHKPEVFLFSGGGNDIAGPELFSFLWNKLAGKPGGGKVLNAQVVAGVVDEVFGQAYIDLVTAIRACAQDVGITKLPFVCHGYGHAIPDGRGWGGGWGPLPGPWLDPNLSRKNWDREDDAKMREAAIAELIDALNTMLARLAKKIPDFHYVDVRGVLTRKDWGNELHPTETGFLKVTQAIEAVLRKVVP
jgi:hypothetical protein